MRAPTLLLFTLTLSAACGDTTRENPDGGPVGARDAGITPDGGARDGGATGGGIPGSDICPDGALLHHRSLTPLANLPAASALDLPDFPADADVFSAGSGEDGSARFDLCEQNGVLSLKQFIYRGGPFDLPRQYIVDDTITATQDDFVETELGFVHEIRVPPSAITIAGLDGPLDDFDIRVTGQLGILVVGHPDFVAIVRAMITGTRVEYFEHVAIVGGLAPGDVFANLVCRFNESVFEASFALGTATFEVEACTFQEAGHTLGYRLTSMAVQDTDPSLTEAERARFAFEDEAALAEVLTYRYNHHNACDSFHLVLPHADYAASTAPAAGCGTTVPEAPPRQFEEDPIRPVLYRIRYHGGAWVDGSLDGCFHYLFCDRF